jgi:hypothetical protein
LNQRENRYLTRQLCWILTVEGVETYVLQPRDPADYQLLTEAVRAVPRLSDIDVVIGMRGPLAPPERCNGLMLPYLAFDQIYSFDVLALQQSVPRPENISADKFGAAVEEVFMRIMQMADNAGGTDEHRALNYLAVRYPALYATAAEAFGRGAALTAVDVRRSRLSGARNLVDVIFSYTHRSTDVKDKYFVRVDVSDVFPFLVTKMSPYFDR